MKITANGINVNYTLDGPDSAPVVTLSHSLANDLTMWDPQLPALTAKFRVLRYDTRGHGGTDAPGGPYTMEQLAEDARALLQALGIARTHFVQINRCESLVRNSRGSFGDRLFYFGIGWVSSQGQPAIHLQVLARHKALIAGQPNCRSSDVIAGADPA